MGPASILGIAMPLISGIAGLFGGSKKETSTSKTSGDFSSDTSGVQFDLPPQLLSILNEMFSGLVGSGAAGTAQQAGVERLNQLREFDPAAWAEQVTQAAATASGLTLQQGIHGTSQAAGGRGSTMATLMENRLRNETAANLSGISAQARATGEQIATGGIAQLMEGIMRGVTDTVAITRGAQTAGSLSEKGKQTGTSTGTAKQSSGGGLGGFFGGLASGLDAYWGKARQ